MGGNIFSKAWLYPVLVLLIVGLISAVLSGTYVGPALVSGILSVAASAYYLKRVRGQAEPENLGVAVDGARGSFTTSLLASFLSGLFMLIGSLLFVIPGIIFSYSFSMVYYVIADRPELGPLEALHESHRLMKGHRFKLFCLQLSFIGWAFLGALCLGVGSLWASAYLMSANAVFYDELVAEDRGYFTVNEPTAEVAE
jgi:uncharacterized membrane protein